MIDDNVGTRLVNIAQSLEILKETLAKNDNNMEHIVEKVRNRTLWDRVKNRITV